MKSLKWTKRSGKDSYGIVLSGVAIEAWLYKSGDRGWRVQCSVNDTQKTFYIGTVLTSIEAKKLAMQVFREWIHKTWKSLEAALLIVGPR